MVNKPVGPPSGPPVPTEGDWLRGSLPGLSVCPATAVIRIKLVSAAKSALLASLIAFLLRNEFKRCGRGDRAPWKSLRRQSPLARSQQPCRGGAWPLPGDACESWARTLQLQAHNLGVKETAAALEPRKSCRWSGAARGAERLKHETGRSSTASVAPLDWLY